QATTATGNTLQPGSTPAGKIATGVGANSDAGLTGSIARPRDVEEAKDAVELLQVQLEGKKAELMEARALMEQARRQLARQDKLRERGAISEEEVDQLRTELTVREARLQVKQAQIKEVEVRLNQANRWLSRLQSGSPHFGDAASGSSLNNPLIGGTSSSRTDHGSPFKTSATGGGLTGPSNQAKSPPDKSAAHTSAGSNPAGPLNT